MPVAGSGTGLAAGDFLGRVTFVTGTGKHCGKTSFANRVSALCSAALREGRSRGERPGGEPSAAAGPALMTVGYDGEARDWLSGARKPPVPVRAGDIVVTAERFLRASGILPEFLEAVPGSTALGRLAIARAGRDGSATLVGPEGNASVSWVLAYLREEKITDTVVVDGAINRVTQVSGCPGARFVYAVRADRAGARKSAELMNRVAALAALPSLDEAAARATGTAGGALGAASEIGPAWRVDGALTAETRGRIPPGPGLVAVEDFTKVFLEARELSALLREKTLCVERRIGFAGFALVLRGMGEDEFAGLLSEAARAAPCYRNPYEMALEEA